jgi:hypothetical protein
MPSGSDREEEDALESLGPAMRARLFRKRAAALEAELAATDLPRLREKLRVAADRFLQLAEAEDRRPARPLEDPKTTRMRIAEALGPMAALLDGPARGP